jgi:predicted RNA-binding Zn-ribbon protein involved in translation (DUF1610 family)
MDQRRIISLHKLEEQELRRMLENSRQPWRVIEPKTPPVLELPRVGDSEDPWEKIARLEEEIRQCRTKIADLEAMIKELLAKLNAPTANSTNSGVSPAQNPLSAPKPGRDGKSEAEGGAPRPGKPGGVPGHKATFRTLFDFSEADQILSHSFEPDEIPPCPHCGEELARDPANDLRQDIYDLPDKSSLKTVELSNAYKCEKCGKIHYARKPEGGFLGGIVTSQVVALMVMLNVLDDVSIRKIREHLRDFHGMSFCHAFVDKCLKHAAFALMPIFLEILDTLPEEQILWIDESTWLYKSKRLFVWVFRGNELVAYKIGTRSKGVLQDAIGLTFGGVISCDYYSVYRSYLKDSPITDFQFCLAHLLRDLQYCADYQGAEFASVREFGEKGVRLVKELIHEYNEDRKAEDQSEDAAIYRKGKLYRLCDELTEHALSGPDTVSKSRGIAKRFATHGKYYFTFLEKDFVPPTNNNAEQSLRGVVIARKTQFFSQSRGGLCFTEVFRSLLGTIKLKGLNARDFLVSAMTAVSEGKPLPSLTRLGETVDPKFSEEADAQFKMMREMEAAMRDFGGVKPFQDDQADSTESSEKNEERQKPSPRKAKTKLRRPGSRPSESEPEKPQAGSEIQRSEPEKSEAKSEAPEEIPSEPLTGKGTSESEPKKPKARARPPKEVPSEPQARNGTTKSSGKSPAPISTERKRPNDNSKTVASSITASKRKPLETAVKLSKASVRAHPKVPSKTLSVASESAKGDSGACPKKGSHGFPGSRRLTPSGSRPPSKARADL